MQNLYPGTGLDLARHDQTQDQEREYLPDGLFNSIWLLLALTIFDLLFLIYKGMMLDRLVLSIVEVLVQRELDRWTEKKKV